jgi:hypothetical protein
MQRESNQEINCSLRDWENKEVLLPQSVLNIHLIDSNHLEAYSYLDNLKQQLNSPESVVASKNRKCTKIVNIRLSGKNHKYLQVVIRYSRFFSSVLGKKNFIVSFYGAQKPKKGKILWKK